jgi:hypothetical protein
VAKLKKKFRLKCLTPPAEFERTGYTRYQVRGDNSPHLRLVRVDREGLWTCTCKSNRFRGMCYHVNMIQFEIERIPILNRLNQLRHEPATVDTIDFEQYFSQQRFVAEPAYKGVRQYILIAQHVWLDKLHKAEWEFKDFHRFAGTVLEGVWDGSKKPRFRVFDCIYHKGLCLKNSPLAFRRDLAESTVAAMKIEEIQLTDYEYDIAGKQNLLLTCGAVVLKDVASPYDLSGKSPRCWMMAKRS